MIVCTRCAAKNKDQALVCTGCGHKLQSRAAGPVPRRVAQDVEGLVAERRERARRLYLMAAEAAGLSLLILGAVAYWMYSARWWPMALAGALGLGVVWYRHTQRSARPGPGRGND